MRAGRNEALDIFRKWFEDRALLRVDLEFKTFAASLRGRILGSPDDAIKIVLDDSFSDVTVRLAAGASFEYGEPDAEFTYEGRELWERGIAVLLPDSEDRITFSEITDAGFKGRS